MFLSFYFSFSFSLSLFFPKLKSLLCGFFSAVKGVFTGVFSTALFLSIAPFDGVFSNALLFSVAFDWFFSIAMALLALFLSMALFFPGVLLVSLSSLLLFSSFFPFSFD
jgi:hypothetical protein